MRGRTQTIAAILVGGVVIVAIAFGSTMSLPALVTSLPTSAPAPVPTGAPTPELPEGSPMPEATFEGSGDSVSGLPIVQTLATLAAIAVALLVAALIVRVARRLAAQESHDPIDDVVEEPLIDVQDVQEVLRAAREQIGVDDDPNRVVVRCWEALEAIAADAGVVRNESDTATEYVVDMLGRLDLPADPARRLSRLYAAALFSRERLPGAAVAEARECLDRLDSAVHRRVGRS
ncbi:DUF4129 domain-containing protein [Microbacterium invictum]|uniref:Protein-glutamine gamma-glutamyltransferase-like C-terminal domain-containing protein n=1 Tax=Microbacterium invictum TaxID=515415 RepID=A0AA40SMR9_9MICO|nr:MULTISPECIES: DUF4129 domain-containing protein [Microbacterium]MBB4139091.1 hypothetical protein [Microbacterium invictum]